MGSRKVEGEMIGEDATRGVGRERETTVSDGGGRDTGGVLAQVAVGAYPETTSGTTHADAVIVGGGPAGVVLAFLLARQGVDVVLLEAQGDFDRDFRGDTIHPAIMELMHALGLAE